MQESSSAEENPFAEEISFQLTQRSCMAEECEENIVYGMALYRGTALEGEVADISSHRSVVERLMELCRRNGVTETTLFDVVEDFLD
ncbi:DUF6514 family protein [Ligaoa zhengdingensis]